VNESLIEHKATFVEGQKILLELNLIYKVEFICRSITAWFEHERNMVAIQLLYPPCARAGTAEKYGVPLCTLVTKSGFEIGGFYWVPVDQCYDLEFPTLQDALPVHLKHHYASIRPFVEGT
jgi:hypothetical protein